MGSITQCDDIQALTELLRRHQRDMNVRHLDAALDRIGKLVAGAGKSSPSPPKHPKAASRAGHTSSRRPANSTGAMDEDTASRLASDAAAAAARATAAQLLASVLSIHAASLSPRDCASILGSLARMDLVPEPQVAQLLQGRLLAQLSFASVRDRAALLHASARLGLGLEPAAVAEVLRSLYGGVLVRSGKPQDVSMVLWALATLRAQPRPAWLRSLLADLPPGRLAAFPPQALANTAWALATLGFRPEPAWIAGLVEASRPLLRVFQMQELCNLLWALAVMRHRPPAPWLVDMMYRLRESAGSMVAQDVANVCWSMSVLGVRPGLGLVQRLVARALAVRREMTPQGLVTTLWGLSRLRVQLPERALALLLQGGLGAAALAGPGPLGPAGLEAGSEPTGLAGFEPGLSWRWPGAEPDAQQGQDAASLSLHRTHIAAAAAVGVIVGSQGGGAAASADAHYSFRSERNPLDSSRSISSNSDSRTDGTAASASSSPSGGRLEASRNGGGGGGRSRGGRGADGGRVHRPAGPEELACVAVVLARCRYVPPRRWLSRYYTAVARQLPGFGTREMATLLYGLAGLWPMGLRPEPRWMDLVLAEVERLAGTMLTPPPAKTKARGLLASGDNRTPLPSSRDPAIYTSAPKPQQPPQQQQPQQLQFQPQQPPLQATPALLFKQSVAFRTDETAGAPAPNVYGKGSCSGSPSGPGATRAPEHLAVMLWAVARLQHPPTEAWVEAMAASVAAHVEDFGPVEATAAVRALQLLSTAAAERSAELGPRPRHDIRLRTRRPHHRPYHQRSLDGLPAAASSRCATVITRLVPRLAGYLPEHSLYRTLQAASQSTGGIGSFATVADLASAEVYSVKSLGLLKGHWELGMPSWRRE